MLIHIHEHKFEVVIFLSKDVKQRMVNPFKVSINGILPALLAAFN
jgi:hypothetical protein